VFYVFDSYVVKNLCLFQVFDWEVKDVAPEAAQLFTDFYAVCNLPVLDVYQYTASEKRDTIQ